MNINTIQTKTISKFFILFITIFLTSACSESGSENELVTLKPDNISEKVIDASKIALLQGKIPYTANKVTQQNTVADSGIFNSTGKFTYPSSATEFSGNISVAFNVSDAEGIKQVLLGFAGSDLALPVCDEDCGNQFSAYVNAINPKLFGLSSGEHNLILWVEDNDGNLSKIATVNLVWTELIVTGVTASLNDNTEELTVSWNTLTGALRYNVYLSNNVNLTHQNYFELEGGEAQLALTTTSATFTDKAIDTTYYILVSAVDGSGESAFSDKFVLIDGSLSKLLSATPDNFIVNEDEILTGNLLSNDIGQNDSVVAVTSPTLQPNHGDVIINGSGEFTYAPNLDFNGLDQFSYTINDSQGLTSTAVVTISILAINDSPTLTSTAPRSATEDILYTYTPTVSDVDDSNNGKDLTWSLTNSPEGMEISSTGIVTWIPAEGQLSSGKVTITVADGGENGSLPATQDFTININSVNDAPIFLDGNTVTVYVNENSPSNTQVYTLSVNDPDPGAELTYDLKNGDGVFQLEAKSGTLYVSNASLLNYESKSSYVFEITVTDEFGLSDTITVTVKVNDIVESTKYALDTSFSNNGIANFNTYADTEYADFLVDAKIDSENNRYLLSYSNKPIDEAGDSLIDLVFTISKIKPDGTFDLSFGNNGRKHLNINNLNDPNVDEFDDSYSITAFKPTKLKIDDTNDKIYVLGYQASGFDEDTAFILKLNNNGTIDNTFDNDGKFLHTNSSEDTKAVDLVIHSDGSLYLAISSTPVIDPQNPIDSFTNFKLDKLTSSGSLIESYSYELISDTLDVYVIGLVENANNNLVVLGYSDDDGSASPMALEMLISDLTPETNNAKTAAEFALGSLTTYKQIDANTVLLGGSTGTDSVIAKLNISSSTPTLDTTFNGGSGFQIIDIDTESVEESMVSLGSNSAGDITYISKILLDSGFYQLFPGQLDSDGIATEVNTSLQSKELTSQSGSGISDGNIHAVVLFDNLDTTNSINIFSSVENDNYNGLSTPELMNTEIEVYYETLANNTSLEVLTSRIDYEFQMADSLAVDTKLLHSSGTIITVTPRYNDSGTGDNLDAEGHTITRHNLVTGLLNQEQNSLVQRNGYSDNYVQRHSTQLIKLAETDSNGDNYLLSVEIIVNNDVSTLRATKFTIDGTISSGFPVDQTLPNYSYFESNAYNSTVDIVALFGGAGYDEDDNNSLLVVIDVACLADGSCEHTAISEQNLGDTNGLIAYFNRLTSGVVQDDGSVIALGFGAVDDTFKEDTFLLKMDFDSDLNGTIDSNFDNSANDSTDDDVLTVSTGNSNNIHSGKLVQLSDSSLVYFATQTESDPQSYLVRLVDQDASSAQKYAIDVNFDDITGGDSAVDGLILLDMDPLNDNNQLDVEVKDLVVNSNDEIILVGNVNSYGSNAGFIAKFNGLNGEADRLLGKNSLSGYYVPNADVGCTYLGGQTEGDLCSILKYDRVSIANDASLIIHALLQDPLGISNNSAILKFKEQQNDNAEPYTIYSGPPP